MKSGNGHWDFKGFFERPEPEKKVNPDLRYLFHKVEQPLADKYERTSRFSEPPKMEEILRAYPALNGCTIEIRTETGSADLCIEIETEQSGYGISIIRCIDRIPPNYEISPTFEGKWLGEMGFADDCIAGLTLDEALVGAVAVASKDRTYFLETMNDF